MKSYDNDITGRKTREVIIHDNEKRKMLGPIAHNSKQSRWALMNKLWRKLEVSWFILNWVKYLSGCSLVVTIPCCGHGDLGLNPNSHIYFFFSLQTIEIY